MPPFGIGIELLPIHGAVRSVPARLQLTCVDLDYRVPWLDSRSTFELRKRHRLHGHSPGRTWTPISLVIAPYRALAPQRMLTRARVGELLLGGCARPETLNSPHLRSLTDFRPSPSALRASSVPGPNRSALCNQGEHQPKHKASGATASRRLGVGPGFRRDADSFLLVLCAGVVDRYFIAAVIDSRRIFGMRSRISSGVESGGHRQIVSPVAGSVLPGRARIKRPRAIASR